VLHHLNKPVTLGVREFSSTAHGSYCEPNTTTLTQSRNLTLSEQPWYRTDPALAQVTAACIIVFVSWRHSWRSPSAAAILVRHFVCSRRNMVTGHWMGLVLSAVSHVDLWHLLFNLAALVSLGPAVRQALEQAHHGKSSNSTSKSSSQLLLWPLMIGAALSGSVAFLVSSKDWEECALGLSAVTSSLLAVYAQAFPDNSIGILLAGILPLPLRLPAFQMLRVSIVLAGILPAPVRLPAYQMLRVFLLWSLVGSIFGMWYPQEVAHSAHLGGLLFGLGYFEFVRRRFQLRAVVDRWGSNIIHQVVKGNV
jgi:membrane associated rhomboid family serine protease